MLDRLRERGWNDQEIADLQERFSPRHEGFFLLFVLMLLLLFAIFGVPYVYALLGHLLTDNLFYTLLVIVGVPLGAVFGVLLVDMYRLNRNHHTALLISVPLVCTGAAGWAMTAAAASAPAGAYSHNALIAALVYAVSFIAPYAFLVRQEWNSRIAFGNS